MKKFNLPLVAEGLTAYAIERQNGTERHKTDGAPLWAEQRRFWTDAILQGMARLDGLTPAPGWMEQFDQRLEAARGCSATETLPMNGQTVLIQELSRYISALESAGDDRRRQIAVVSDLLGDMITHLSWGLTENGLSHTREQAERSLACMTAQMPIRFTHISLGGDAGPHWVSGFASGSITDDEAVKKSSVYQEAVRDYPEITDWPTFCTVYVGRGLSSALGTVDASDFDLEIMNRTGDRFLDEQGIRWVGGPYQMTISTAPIQSQDKPSPFQMGPTM